MNPCGWLREQLGVQQRVLEARGEEEMVGFQSDSQRLQLRREGVRFVIAVIAGAAAIAALALALPFG